MREWERASVFKWRTSKWQLFIVFKVWGSFHLTFKRKRKFIQVFKLTLSEQRISTLYRTSLRLYSLRRISYFVNSPAKELVRHIVLNSQLPLILMGFFLLFWMQPVVILDSHAIFQVWGFFSASSFSVSYIALAVLFATPSVVAFGVWQQFHVTSYSFQSSSFMHRVL